VWPPEDRAEYRTASGYRAAQAVRLLAYLLVFLPLAGVPALIASFVQQLWALAKLPVRAARWLSARARAEARAG
jgi:hypothetical protein